MSKFLFVLILIYTPVLNSDRTLSCANSVHHKAYPTPEKQSELGRCSGWADTSCCDKEMAYNISNSDEEYYTGVPFNQCPEIKNLSKKCRDHFIGDLCLYFCGSMFDPWIVSSSSEKIRTQRIKNIPLCKKDCDEWFEACKDDFTCSDTWYPSTFDKINGQIKCKSPCKTFLDYHQNAQKFCETIFSGYILIT
uniref:Folate receptor beta (Trinotate prediction) n=1 Tax=Myxobolus squamalis TaxID=59785 RepID=A0A6B2FYP2_MYXSQ